MDRLPLTYQAFKFTYNVASWLDKMVGLRLILRHISSAGAFKDAVCCFASFQVQTVVAAAQITEDYKITKQ